MLNTYFPTTLHTPSPSERFCEELLRVAEVYGKKRGHTVWGRQLSVFREVAPLGLCGPHSTWEIQELGPAGVRLGGKDEPHAQQLPVCLFT